MSANYGYFRAIDGVEDGRFLEQMTFDSGLEAVGWLEKNAGGIWGKSVWVSKGSSWEDDGVWVFTHRSATEMCVVVRRLSELDKAVSDKTSAWIAQIKGERGSEKYLGSIYKDGKMLNFYAGEEDDGWYLT